MLTVVGLGNPGAAYRKTRHNAGFMLLDEIHDGRLMRGAIFHSSGSGISKKKTDSKRKFKNLSGPAVYVASEGELSGKKFLLVKPTTFMNESGKAFASLVTRGNIKDLSELLVIVDDVDLEIGTVRLREKGSAGGHNGLRSVIDHLGTTEFMRLKIGVGPRPEGSEMIDYVLGTFRPEEFERYEQSLQDASNVVEAWITGGYENANIAVSLLKSNNNKSFQGENP